MGTHPIFESDFDCLTEHKMGEGFIIDDRNIKVNFIGKAQATQVFHTCEQCSQPIIYYGRMIPCKHIFCFTCACQTRETDQNCPRCHDPVQRIEKCPRMLRDCKSCWKALKGEHR